MIKHQHIGEWLEFLIQQKEVRSVVIERHEITIYTSDNSHSHYGWPSDDGDIYQDEDGWKRGLAIAVRNCDE